MKTAVTVNRDGSFLVVFENPVIVEAALPLEFDVPVIRQRNAHFQRLHIAGNVRADVHVGKSGGLGRHTENVLDEHRDRCTCPRMTEAGVPLLILAPRLKAGGRTLADHLIPRMDGGVG